jgi:translation initiation factor IF-3
MAYLGKGEEILNKFIERVQDVAKVESSTKLEGRYMSLIIISKGKKKNK